MSALRQADPPARQEPLFDGEFSFTGRDFEVIAGIVHERAGISLPATKGALVYSRLVRRLRLLGLDRFSDYCALLTEPGGADECDVMLRALTTNVTRFFREPHHFDDLYNQIVDLVPIVRGGGRMRLWSAGCSTGQEPYSMAMTLLSVLPDAANLDVKILASDIDTDVLAIGRRALYEEEELDAVPANLRGGLERAASGAWRVGQAARKLVSFKELNLNAPNWPMHGAFQAIFCRNVAIYFDDPTQERLWRRFAPITAPHGRLYVGHSERVDDPAFQSCGLTAYRRGEPRVSS
jgi:chemotaxis protein methyltransferase CheR